MQGIGRKLNLGIIGMSEGNGHPYSWSAIFNGFDSNELNNCPFPVIQNYLENKSFPEDFLDIAKVTHIWTNSREQSEKISKFSRIENIVDNMSDMENCVDGILLARDDSEMHYKLGVPFLKKGLPVYFDKPFALSENKAKKIFNEEVWDGQIFTCSALRYASEIKFSEKIRKKIGSLKKIIGITPNSWEKYGIHVVEPIIELIGSEDKIKDISIKKNNLSKICDILWESNLETKFISTGEKNGGISIEYFGDKGKFQVKFKDSFGCFKKALQEFCLGIKKKKRMFNKNNLLLTVRILEIGSKK